ncbi:response regulator transcription factor [Jiangella gansuensis]|uniref:response regulator transcription factor n=1 Tax=Jiangella gansuensis TaxID=281473 RepID=UPI00047CEA48|nr:response regulator transcription factor [Jiangella gansuensis]
MASLLIVGRDQRVSVPVRACLGRRGYVTQIYTDPVAAYAPITVGLFDVVLVDIGGPGDDAWRLLGQLRSAGYSVPVIALAGPWDRTGELCRRHGADDVLGKPLRFDQLPDRVVQRLRRPATATADVAGIRLDVKARRAWVAGRQVQLTDRELALLQTMGREPGRVFGRAQLLSQVWDRVDESATNLVAVYVNALRRKLGPGVIETVRGAGYRLTAQG